MSTTEQQLIEATGFDTFEQALDFIREQRDMVTRVESAIISCDKRDKEAPLEKERFHKRMVLSAVPALKTGIADVIHGRICYTETIPEALDVELGFVNGGPDNLRCCDIAGERYIHAHDLAQLLDMIPKEPPE